MIELLGKTQQELLRLLNKHRKGLAISELTELLGVTRTAVKQHLSSLEKNALVCAGPLDKTAGRPSQKYILTEEGRERFPRQYSWFAEFLLAGIKEEKDEKGLRRFLDKLARSISSRYLPELMKLKQKERLKESARVLSQLGYDAEIVSPEEKGEVARLEVSNCVFYQLAQTCPEICGFDLKLLTELSGHKLEQKTCIAKGGDLCCFGIKNEK